MRRLHAEFLGGGRGFALLLLRLVAGTAMMIHGSGKIAHPTSWMGPDAPVPGLLQAAAAVSEFGGGLAWILGVLTPLASLGLIGTMGFATFMVHVRSGHPFVATKPGAPSAESAAGYLVIAILLLLVGPGRLSIDSFLFGRGPVAETDPARKLAG